VISFVQEKRLQYSLEKRLEVLETVWIQQWRLCIPAHNQTPAVHFVRHLRGPFQSSFQINPKVNQSCFSVLNSVTKSTVG
jgi:hypothetical protein